MTKVRLCFALNTTHVRKALCLRIVSSSAYEVGLVLSTSARSLGLAGDEQQALTCGYFSVAPQAVTSGGRP